MDIPALTDRQIQILKCVIDEHIKTGEAVGSDTLDKKYNLGVSPATIRNEMVILTQQGFLEQPHTSSGRIPTPMALKFFIKQLMHEKDLGVSEEVDVKAKIWDYRDRIDRLLHESTKVLSHKTNSIALALTDQGDVYHAGYSNILDLPEFFDIDVTKTVLSLLDDLDTMQKILNRAYGEEAIHVLIGDDFDIEFLYSCGMVYTDINLGSYGGGRIGVLGPSRLDYPYIIPVVRYFGKLINEITKNWE
ncbi:hypothetical protein GYA19_01180 [Candidatus Beckwithbacteria bacterium]|nr:hypothetical protein [Candidatus Beckwithbacteria bacterium]